VVSKQWQTSTNKKEVAFRHWLIEVGALTEEVPRGIFKESGTQVATVILTINKMYAGEEADRLKGEFKLKATEALEHNLP
jgi:hypothetical protein